MMRKLLWNLFRGVRRDSISEMNFVGIQVQTFARRKRFAHPLEREQQEDVIRQPAIENDTLQT